jgi:hypothetical protein
MILKVRRDQILIEMAGPFLEHEHDNADYFRLQAIINMEEEGD